MPSSSPLLLFDVQKLVDPRDRTVASQIGLPPFRQLLCDDVAEHPSCRLCGKDHRHSAGPCEHRKRTERNRSGCDFSRGEKKEAKGGNVVIVV